MLGNLFRKGNAAKGAEGDASPLPVAVLALAGVLDIAADAADAGARLGGQASAKGDADAFRADAARLRAEGDASASFAEGLLERFHKARSQEIQGFRTAIKETRLLLWGLVNRLAHALAESKDETRLLEAQAQSLAEAVRTGSFEQLKAAASAAVKSLEGAVAERRRRTEFQRKALGEELAHLASQLDVLKEELHQDGLTKVNNRRALDEHLAHVTSLCRLLGRQATLCLFDIDHFKKVNDTHGHAVGDEALRVVGRLLLEHFPRRIDFVARYGGEEFCVVLLEETAEGAARRASRFADALRKQEIARTAAPADTPPLRVSVSGGVTTWRENETVESWLERADALLYEAKKQGRDRILLAPLRKDAP